MNRKDFGQLVATLRKEAHNEFDEHMTQYDLAKLAQVPLITIQKIEQGRQENIKPEVLSRLANTLNLSSRARQVFFLSSLGIMDSETIKPVSNPLSVLDELNQTLSRMQIPAFILDSFGDIVTHNPGWLAIYDLADYQLDTRHMLSRYNLNRFLFSPEFSKQQAMLGKNQFDFARQMVNLFKLWTLKIRNHWYFERLLPELNHYQDFSEHWQTPAFHNEDIFVQYCPFSLNHPILGQLEFLFTPIQAITANGDLYLVGFQPLDAQTAKVCVQVSEEYGTTPISGADWPKPASLNSLH